MTRMRVLLGLAVATALPFLPTRASAHGQRIARVALVERTPERAELTLELSVPEPLLSFSIEGCSVVELGDHREALERRFTIACATNPPERGLRMLGLGPIIDRAVVHVTHLSGTESTALLSPDAPVLSLSQPAAPAHLFMRYFRLGLHHIATGPDHLLFLLLLVLALRRLRPVLLAESAFTLSHTFSYAATAFGWLHLPSAPTEVCIALSLLLLAADVNPRAPLSATRGAVTAFVFGFVHGLGFAGGLQEVGVDERAAAFGVLAFGGGVEVAQVTAVLVGWVGIAYAARLRAWPSIAEALILGGGAASAYWLIERSIALVS